MPNAVISQITLPSGTTYDIKDAEARSRLESLEGITGALLWKGVTAQTVIDGSSTAPNDVYTGTATPATGDVILAGKKEFVWDGSKWQELGDLSDLTALMGDLGDLAYEDTATGTASLSNGVAAAQTFTGTQATINSTGSTSGVAVADIDYTPAGNISETAHSTNTFVTAVTPQSTTQKVLDADGTVTAGSAAAFTQGTDTFTATVANENLTLGFIQGTDSFTPNAPTAVTLPTFKDQAMVSSVNVTDDNAVNIPTAWSFAGTEATLEHDVTQGTVSASATYTPAGTNGTSEVTGSVTVTVSPSA